MPEVRIKKISLKSHYPNKNKTYWRKKFTTIIGPSKFYWKAMVPMPSPTSTLIKVSRIWHRIKGGWLGVDFPLPPRDNTAVPRRHSGKRNYGKENYSIYKFEWLSSFQHFIFSLLSLPTMRRIFSIHPKWSWTVKRRSWPACPRITWASHLCFKTCQSQLHVTILAVWLSEHCIWFRPSRLLINCQPPSLNHPSVVRSSLDHGLVPSCTSMTQWNSYAFLWASSFVDFSKNFLFRICKIQNYVLTCAVPF